MDYRFEISLPTSSDFRCEIAVGGEQTFQQFHDKIVETLNYDSSQMASFFTLDRMGNRVKEIALMDMTTEDEENETLVMDNTKISDIIKPGCLELEYVYDFFSNKYFKVEYAGEYYQITRIDDHEGYKTDIDLYCKTNPEQHPNITEE